MGTPERTGYTFTGWDKTVSALVLEDTTYTATWQANTYTVTLEANGGELDANTLPVTFDAPIGELPVPTLAGHTFLGWFDANGEAVTAETLYRFAGDSVFTAKWSENTPPTEPSVPTDPTEPKPTEPKPTGAEAHGTCSYGEAHRGYETRNQYPRYRRHPECAGTGGRAGGGCHRDRPAAVLPAAEKEG